MLPRRLVAVPFALTLLLQACATAPAPKNVPAAPLAAAGYGDARVIVTFPPERTGRNQEQWDVTTPVNEVLANRQRQR